MTYASHTLTQDATLTDTEFAGIKMDSYELNLLFEFELSQGKCLLDLKLGQSLKSSQIK